jgi:hypothetical protein
MAISMHALALGSLAPLLRTFDANLDKAAAHAAAAGYDVQVLIDSRLAPDMNPLWFQVKFGCHQATEFTALLLGREAKMFSAEGPNGLADLKALVAATLAKLDALREADFDGSAEREVSMPLQNGALTLKMPGLRFLQNWILPQVYFHVTTAYAILRHNGVPLGIQDFMSQHVGGDIRPAT